MRHETSIFLDAMRFAAALVVFIGHLSGKRFTGGFLWPLSTFQDSAVILFFVLSGFVIAYVTDTKEATLHTYAVNRFARVYSVALPALVVTFALDSMGQYFKPDFYDGSWGFSFDNPWLQYLTALTFTNQLWWAELNPGSMLPYWSLSYEVWYYIIFAAIWFGRGYYGYLIAIAICCLAGPSIMSLFPIWLMGFGCYHLSKRSSFPKNSASFVSTLASIAVLALLTAVVLGELRITADIGVRYLEGLVVALVILAMQLSRETKIDFLLRMAARPVKWMAARTFSLYLFHLPVAQFLTTVAPWPPHNTATRMFILVGTASVVFLLAEISERQKGRWRQGIELLMKRFHSRSAGAQT